MILLTFKLSVVVKQPANSGFELAKSLSAPQCWSQFE